MSDQVRELHIWEPCGHCGRQRHVAADVVRKRCTPTLPVTCADPERCGKEMAGLARAEAARISAVPARDLSAIAEGLAPA